ncbi:MAG: signal peptidase II [Gemmatimonadota bacterium]|nr:signal peptidase II [Gemmatimonadota bacterium]
MLAGSIVLLDVLTKWLAERDLHPLRYAPREVVGSWVRLTLVYNKGAAFGLNLGPYSRWIFMALTIVALLILVRLYRATGVQERLRLMAIGLVCGGALGNLIDRVRSDSGVVDFLDVGIADHRWPTFNVADIAVSVGAFLLAWALWGEETVRDVSGSRELSDAGASVGD